MVELAATAAVIASSLKAIGGAKVDAAVDSVQSVIQAAPEAAQA